MRLYTKIMLLNIAVVLCAMISFVPFATITITENLSKEFQLNIMNTAITISESTAIRGALENGDPTGKIAGEVGAIHERIKDIQFIVVADMNSLRYAHPDPEKIGKYFVGGDDIRVVETGEAYISEAVGTLGESLRAFVPIYDLAGNTQIGFVAVGTLTESINAAQRHVILNILIVAFIGLIVGSIGAVLLTNNIKQKLLGLEPEEITELYNEKDSMLKAIHEGIVAIDSNGKINMINDSAMGILQLDGHSGINDIIGKPIDKIFKNTKLPQILMSGESEYNDELMVNSTVIVANRVPIINGDKTIGAIATFKDKTQVTRLAEEVTGVNQIVAALRANTHEFMNKLHVILGLLQMKKYDEARAFIITTSESQEVILNKVIKKIEDPTIAGLIIGKISRAKELGIRFIIDDDSCLAYGDVHGIQGHVMVTVIGNLLENAFEAVDKSVDASDEVRLKIVDSNQEVIITVADTGIGIAVDKIPFIFQRGYTTKDGSEGVGLHLVEKYVFANNGSVDVVSQPAEGTVFTVKIPKSLKEGTL